MMNKVTPIVSVLFLSLALAAGFSACSGSSDNRDNGGSVMSGGNQQPGTAASNGPSNSGMGGSSGSGSSGSSGGRR